MAKAASKRAPFPRTCDFTRTFQKDHERLSRSGRYDMHRLKDAMLLLIANDAPLGPEGSTTRSRANGQDIANATSAAISC